MLALALCGLAAVAPAAAGQTFVNPTLTAPPGAEYVPYTGAFMRAQLPPEPSPSQMATLTKERRDSVRTAHEREVTRVEAEHDSAIVAKWRFHYAWADRNEDAFRLAVERAVKDPGHANERMQAGDSAYVAVGLAMIAANPLDYDDALDVIKSSARRDSVSVIQDQFDRRLTRTRRQIEGIPIIVFATGTVTESLGDPKTADDDGKKPIGTGSLGATVETDAGRFTARVSIISTDAVAPADFGPLVLTPGAGASLAAGVLDWRAPWRDFPNHLYANTSTIRLRAGTAADASIVRATVFGAGALWARDVFAGPLFNSRASLTVEGGAALRWLHGDVHESPFFADLFEDGNAAFGPELGFAFSFGRVIAGTQLYHLWNTSGDDVPGLTGLQMVAGLAVTGEFISGNLPALGRRGDAGAEARRRLRERERRARQPRQQQP
ncbi:MAG TPA: hypothetical protein VF746_30095 [Longimicrobium sp.]